MKKRVFTKFMSMTLAAAILLSFTGVLHADEKDEGIADDLVFEDITIEENGVSDVEVDSSELAENYIMDKMAGEKKTIGYKFDYANQLTGYDREVYDILFPYMSKIASGDLTSTKITIPQSEFAVSFSNEDLGIDDFTALDNAQLSALAVANNPISQNNILNALMYACPYEMYWYDRPAGTKVTYGVGRSKTQFVLLNYTFSFRVARAYRDVDEFSVNKTYGNALKSAVSNAGTILSVYSVAPDYYKLLGYNNEICEMVDYDHDAAGTDLTNYGNPWQLVWVFDGDPSTKAVCEGYAKAFQYLCDKTDFISDEIYTVSVKGDMGKTTEEPGGHEWNIVHMDDGLNYLVDATNSDGNSHLVGGEYTLLFMVGYDSGSVADGYRFKLKNTNTIVKYDYWSSTKSFYGDPVLTLEKKSQYSDGYDPKYPRTLKIGYSSGGGAEFAMSGDWACAGDLINIWTYPDEGYEVEYITVNGKKISGNSFYMPGRNVEVYVQFKKIDYKITLNTGEGGGVMAPVTANLGDRVELDCSPMKGYELDSIRVDGKAISGNSFFMPNKDVTVDITFKKTVYSISVATPEHGKLTVSSNQAFYGDKIKVTATPDTGYELDCIKVSDKVIDGNEFVMPADSVYVVAYFKKAEYQITTTHGTGGSASTSVSKANYQDPITVNVVPDTGYEVDQIKVNGNPISGNTFKMPANNVFVEVTFKQITYKINLNPTGGGTFRPSSLTAVYGDDIRVNTSPLTGYEVDKILVNGSPISGSSFKMPASDVTLEVRFKKTVYGITLNSGEGGSVDLSRTSACYGDEVQVLINEEEGYHLVSAKVNGVDLEGTVFEMPAGNVTVEVVFAKDRFGITVNGSENGSAFVSFPEAEWGSEVSVTTVPDKGYEVDKIIVTPEEGDPVDITGSGKFTMPRANVVVDVTFKKEFVPTPTATATPTPEPAKPTATATPTAKPAKPTATATPKPSKPVVTAKPTVKPSATSTPVPTKASAVSLTLDKASVTVVCGKTAALKATVKGTSSKVAWKSSNSKIASVDASGKITAKQAGSATITATVAGKSASCAVQVLFKDVTDSKEFWYAPTYYLVNKDVVKGYENQTLFKPTVECTRAQMLTFMWRLAGSPNPKSNKCSFPDVKSSDYFFKPVIWAVEKGITTGYSDGTFKPQNVCTRAQTVTFLWRMAGKPNPKSSVNKFSDVREKDYFYKATLWASEKKILAGYSDGSFKPAGLCLRRQMVTFLYKYDKYINGKG